MKATKPRSPKPKPCITRSRSRKRTAPAGEEIGCSVPDECRSEASPGCLTVNVPKIKLQLFPIDEGTRTELVKDGFHPYLELTLSMRKRICSVLRHFNAKWSGSSVVRGEPVLFPFDLASHCWTLNDSETSAGEVYAAIGSPSVFRLRYGWISNSESESVQVPQTELLSEAPFQPDVMPDVMANVNIAGGEGREPGSGTAAGVTDGILDDKSLCRPVSQSQVNETSANVGVGQSLALWDDNLTNISIGGLLSEASLQGKLCTHNPQSNDNNTVLQQSQLVSDSFDAFIASQVNCSQGPKPMPHGSSISILDAEDTCQPFSFQKSSSASVNSVPVDLQPGQSREQSCTDFHTELPLCSRLHNDGSSLGLSGIKWNDSLGPFDFGLSSSRKISGDDSFSLGRIIS